MKKKRNGKLFAVVGVCVLLAAALVTGMILLVRTHRPKTAEDTFREMQQKVNDIPEENGIAEKEEERKKAAESAGSVPDSEEAGQDGAGIEEDDTLEGNARKEAVPEIPEKNLDWEELRKLNPDIYAWVYVPDTAVDYPVLQHPTDNSYYLDYNIDGTKGYPGCIYTENYNRKDFTDPHTVMYGHNLKNKTMFSTLHNFEDPALVKEDHYIFVYTEDKTYVYLIFGAYEYYSIHLLTNFDLENEYVFEQCIRNIFRAPELIPDRVENIRDDVEVTAKDRILTLSTCTRDSSPNYRFLVTGVLLNP